MRIVTFLVLAAVLALGTVFLGWWSVAVLGLVWGLVSGWRARGRGEPLLAAVAAAFAWAVLLAIDASGGQLGGLGRTFGAIAKLPPAVFFAMTLIFPAVLAWSAAALGGSVWPRRDGSRHEFVPASRVLSGDPVSRAD